MPELPEVEVTRRGLQPHLIGKRVTEVVARVRSLRNDLGSLPEIEGLRLTALVRRAKYLLWVFEDESGLKTWLLSHMGMSGSWRVYDKPFPEAEKHEHVDLIFGATLARYRDPRRFGAMIVMHTDPYRVPPLSRLGPEPFDPTLTQSAFAARLRKKHKAIKQVLLDGSAVVGCGNIYACVALFEARIDPRMPAEQISDEEASRLLAAIRKVLGEAIDAGGSTLRDFHGTDGSAGWFALHTCVYDREGEPCPVCGTPIVRISQGQRSTYLCPKCQKVTRARSTRGS